MRRGTKKCGKREKAGNEHWKKLLLGVVMSVLATIGLLGICSVLISSGVIPETTGDGCVLLSCALGTLMGGRAAVRKVGQGALLWGLAVGLLVSAMFGLSGFLLFDRFESGRCAAVCAACLCGGGLAGVLGGSKKRRF